jgi:hypothetical protein
MLCCSAQAGLFGSDEPPKELLNSEIAGMLGTNNLQSYGFTVRQLTDAYKTGATTSWDKDGGGWIFHVDRQDKMSGQKTKIAIMFQAIKDGKAMVTKWNVDGEYLSGSLINGELFFLE